MTHNFATSVAFIGAGGRSGRPITDALIATGKHKITAITRQDSSASFPDGIHAVEKVDYTSVSDLTAALQGQDVLICALAVGADSKMLYRIVDAAVAAGVRFVFPNEWGGDIDDQEVARDTGFYERFKGVRDYVETQGQGKTAWIGVACGFWYEFSLAGTEARYGFDFEEKKVTFFNDGNLTINTTTWPQLGRAVAALLSLNIDRRDGGNHGEPVISDWANRSLKINSFVVSQREMLDSVLRVTGDKAGDWKIQHEDVVERYNRGWTLMKAGQMVGFCIQLYARNFYPRKPGRPVYVSDNEKLGLPKEDFDLATRVAVDMAERGETNAIH